MKGLKQMVADAESPAPVEISDEAYRALAVKMREWSGWRDSTLVLGDPSKMGSPFAACDHIKRQFTANPDRLVLNPNRVMLTVTPFRLKQEAVLTGALLHEAGHARYSKWQPGRYGNPMTLLHSDGSPVTRQTLALARVMEEPRVEALIARDSGQVGAAGLDWTMRASSAHLLPMTAVAADPNQQILDLITSWALRAGRQIALNQRTGFHMRPWVSTFNNLMRNVIIDHLEDREHTASVAAEITTLLMMMLVVDDHTGPTMVDRARDVLALLFPETEDDEKPEAGSGCSGSEGQQGEESEGESSDAGESGEAESDEDETGNGDTEAESEEDPSDEGDGASPSTDEEDPPESDEGSDLDGSGDEDPESELSKALRDMENQSKSDTEEQAEEQTKSPGGLSGGDGGDGGMGEGWRDPTKGEREIQHGAERFLRGLIAPSEASKVVLNESPSATVDGAALAAWKAGGQVRDPMFFRRTRREVEPSPPVKVAVLVDVSGSMEELQAPSAILSWALASAALDLRNFAGRGQQIESTLIHWGSSARVIQKNGQMMPGIREVPCLEGTNAMDSALDLVAEQLPGFFDIPEHPENRLLVQFTDWELSGWNNHVLHTADRIHKALAAGVNMITVAPHDYQERRSNLPDIIRSATSMRGTSTLLRYNKMFPEQVWDHAAQSLVQ